MLVVQQTHDPDTAAATHMAAPARAEKPPPRVGPKLQYRLREALRSRYYSRRTEETYRHWVKRFIKHVRCHIFHHSLAAHLLESGYDMLVESGTSYTEGTNPCFPSYTDCIIIVSRRPGQDIRSLQ